MDTVLLAKIGFFGIIGVMYLGLFWIGLIVEHGWKVGIQMSLLAHAFILVVVGVLVLLMFLGGIAFR